MGEHAVDAKVPADIAEKLDVLKRQQPVGIVDHQCFARSDIDKMA
jgi:hypothetical protein